MFYQILTPIFEKDYLILLKVLKDHADEIAIVTYYPAADNSDMAIKATLLDLHTKTEWMKKWPGTVSGDQARVDFYDYNNISYNLLKKSRSLISINQEQTIDVFFLSNDKCVFYSVIHEDIYVITNPLLAEAFRTLGYTLHKFSGSSSKFFV